VLIILRVDTATTTLRNGRLEFCENVCKEHGLDTLHL
jgi:hypothetical protein